MPLGIVPERFDVFPPWVGYSQCQTGAELALDRDTMSTRAMGPTVVVCTIGRYRVPDEKCDHYPRWRQPKFSILALWVWGEKDAEGNIVLPCLHWWDVQENSRTIVPRLGSFCDSIVPPRFTQFQRRLCFHCDAKTSRLSCS